VDAEEFAEHKERETRLEEDPDHDGEKVQPDALSEAVPANVTVKIKKINHNRYYQ